MQYIFIALLGLWFLGELFYAMFLAPTVFDNLPDPVTDKYGRD